jgi:hypothetical protein
MEFRILNNQRRLNFSKHLFGKKVTAPEIWNEGNVWFRKKVGHSRLFGL